MRTETMNQNDITHEIIKAVPGTVGAIVALRWIAGPPTQRVMALVGGVAASYYGSAHVASLMGTDTGLAGFMVGLFGMALASKVFEGIAALNPSGLVERVLKRLGL